MSYSRNGIIRLWMITAVFTVVVTLLLLSACSMPRNVLPVVKIGLVASFEGPQRTMAYDTLLAVKLAIEHHNDISRANGPLVELVALNDDGQSEDSKQQALQMVADPAILGVIGPWMAHSAAAGNDIYREARLAVVYPVTGPRCLTSSFQTLAHRPQTSQAILAHDAANILLEAIREISSNSSLTRENVFREVQAQKNSSVFTDPVEFDER